MKKRFLSVLGALTLGLVPIALAQTPQPKPAPPVAAAAPAPVALTTTETVAIGALAEKLQANQKERESLTSAIRRIEADIAVSHPGYHLDESTGQLVKDTAAAGAPAKK